MMERICAEDNVDKRLNIVLSLLTHKGRLFFAFQDVLCHFGFTCVRAWHVIRFEFVPKIYRSDVSWAQMPIAQLVYLFRINNIKVKWINFAHLAETVSLGVGASCFSATSVSRSIGGDRPAMGPAEHAHKVMRSLSTLLDVMADCLEVVETIPLTVLCKLCESGRRFPKLKILSCSPNWFPVGMVHLDTLGLGCPALCALDRVHIEPPCVTRHLPALLHRLTCLQLGVKDLEVMQTLVAAGIHVPRLRIAIDPPGFFDLPNEHMQRLMMIAHLGRQCIELHLGLSEPVTVVDGDALSEQEIVLQCLAGQLGGAHNLQTLVLELHRPLVASIAATLEDKQLFPRLTVCKVIEACQIGTFSVARLVQSFCEEVRSDPDNPQDGSLLGMASRQGLLVHMGMT